mgnify:CR=1 FL=1
MKRLILLLAAITITFNNAKAQSCLPQGIAFTSQSQIDNFQTNYPGCTEIEGDVTINGSNITNLNGLSVLTSIGGNLTVGRNWNTNPSLTSLTGLENLAFIGGHLLIHNSISLTSLTGLDNLTIIEGNLSIWGNNALVSLTVLSNLTFVGGGLNIYSNTALASLTGLENLSSIGGNITIQQNNALTSLMGLENLSSIGGSLRIGENDALASLTELVGLIIIEGGLSIFSNLSLVSLMGLENLVSIGGGLSISGNNALTSLSELENVTSIGGSLSISGNNALTSLTGLENLTSFPDNLYIGSNNSITSLAGLENLTSIGGYLWISSNNALTSLTGLDNLTSIGGELTIYYNSSLSTCDSEWLCDYLSAPNGYVRIFGNASGCSLIDVAFACGGIPCLPYGHYDLRSQSDIDNFQVAFPNCTELQGDVRIVGNDITNLSGLDIVTSIGGSFSIYYNNNLTSLSGLENLTSIGGYLNISDNTSLSTCNNDWLCDYLAAPAGQISIYNNAPGCSMMDIAIACGGMPCLPSHCTYYFSYQSDIDNFQAAFPNCTELQGDVRIFGNDITNLSGLGIMTSIEGGLFIGSTNSSLTNLTGLENLASIGNLWIWTNNGLTSLIGLENLTSAGGLLIMENESLNTLTGLDNIAASSIESLYIWDNPLLSSCEVQSICDFLAAPNGEVIIDNNAPGCNSPEEVIVACATVGIGEVIAESSFSIFPNPFTSQLTIEFNMPQTSIVSIQIFNAMGAKVAELHHGQLPAGQQQFTWYAGDLRKGMYLCRVQAGKEVALRKIMKL